MKRSTTPSFIITLPLLLEPWQEHRLDTDFAVSCKIYNSLRCEVMNRYNQMVKTKRYRYWLKPYRKEKKGSELRKQAKEQLESMRKEFRLSKYDVEKDIKKYQHYYSKNLHSAVAQKLVEQLWKSFDKLLFGNGQTVHFKRCDDFTSIEGKSNETGIVYANGYVGYNKMRLKVLANTRDPYVEQALRCRVKFCRLCRSFIRGKWKYSVQLILEGQPPVKVTDTGEIKHSIGTGRVGLDIGPQTLAVAAANTVRLVELADKIQNIENQLRVINRAMDRSRRATNPSFFNEDGTIIKRKPNEKRIWNTSTRYKKLAAERKDLYRKQAAIRKQQHFELANYIVSLGDEVYIEDMNFSALARRAKKTTVSEKTGKCRSKKRFGKSLANKAPAMFVSILEQKLNSTGGHLYKVKTKEMKASQYKHDTQTYKKSKLSERTKEVAGQTVQRDLYSAFLLMNSNPTLDKPDQNLCEKNFDAFLKLHTTEIQRLKTLSRLPSSVGIKSIKTA